ncbi:Endo-1,4-beta-xylanase [Rhodothermus marinus SG0.5JP17-172]|uniref:endo-1,4-beta-xylanase n=1 Tax=Rhodothermus marinus TaxID=29549 RepID=UPI000223D98D|nr:endo-1,4-beta-xylanase [Rhodothermus marinus]AEN72949.1 Endo-1,4-beta-xylanase [Rhodothermus marinus SG0.5JP17-172]MBO2492909.1 glycoside hydrolase [Rhodothermus marinus]
MCATQSSSRGGWLGRLCRVTWAFQLGLLLLGNAPVIAQSWRAAALQRIEQYRKGTIRVQVLDPDGRPVEGAQVHVRMRRHAFGFGTAVSFGLVLGPNAHPVYRAKLEDLTGDGRTFNMATPENALKWPWWEAERPIPNAQKIEVIDWLRALGYEIRGHNLLWPDWRWLPQDVAAHRDDPAYIHDRVRRHIAAVAGHPGLRGKLRDWDVLNEPAHLTALRDVFDGWGPYRQGEDFYVDVFRWAKAADSSARLFINEFNIINNYANEEATRAYYKQIIAELLAQGAPLEGIGIQSHFTVPLPSMTEVKAALDSLAAFGLPLSITEYDVRGASEQAEASFMEDFLTMVFSHPAVESFIMWGFWDGAHWRDDAPLFREDWTLKPSGKVFLDLVFNRWWTDTTGVTGPDGSWTVRGFLGDYEVTVRHEDLRADREMSLRSRSDTSRVTVVLGATGELMRSRPKGSKPEVVPGDGTPVRSRRDRVAAAGLSRPGPLRLYLNSGN